MKEPMNSKFRLYRRRGGVYYYEDRKTRKQLSLGTKDKNEAIRLWHAHNEAHEASILNGQIARVYLNACDPELAKRTWRTTFDGVVKTKEGKNRVRWERAIIDPAFDTVRDLALVDTRPEHLLNVLCAGTVSTNVFLRRVHNFALGVSWLPWPVLPPKQWPKPKYKEKRAITADEHDRIVAREANPERRAFYSLVWELGGSQSDVANLCAEDIDWKTRTIAYFRLKTKAVAQISFSPQGALERLLRQLPNKGQLFPYLSTVRECDRATEFRQRCAGLGITGVTLHSYRYAWAERARERGYPERFAQEALGHGSKAVHRAYSRRAKVKIPSLDEWSRSGIENNIVPVEFPARKETSPNVGELVMGTTG